MTCHLCGDTGFDRHVRRPCVICPLGAALRIQSNRETILAQHATRPSRWALEATQLAARQHTDAHDDRAESIAGPGPFPDEGLTHETVEQRLRSVGYREPVLGHFCRSCNAELLPGQPCGAHCSACAKAASSLHLIPSAEGSPVVACAIGIVIGVITCAVALKACGWLP